MILLLTLSIFHSFFTVAIVDFEQVSVNCVALNIERIRHNLKKHKFAFCSVLVFIDKLVGVQNWKICPDHKNCL